MSMILDPHKFDRKCILLRITSVFPFMKKRGILFLVILIAVPVSAQYYGFGFPSPNLNIITNSVGNQAFTQSVIGDCADDEPDQETVIANPATLRFTPDLAVRKRNLAGFISKTREQSPESADQMTQMFASTDIFAAISQGLAPMGLRVDNVADAYTVYWVTAWEASRGISGTDTPRAQAQAVKAQATKALLSTPAFATSTPAQRQEMAEALLIQAALISASMEGAAGDPAQKKAVGQAVRTGAKAMGIDLDAMTLGEAGFVPSGKQARASNPPASAVLAPSRSLAKTSKNPNAAGATSLSNVPMANRPVALALSLEMRFGGQFFTQEVRPWAVFANGFASNGKCAAWNPLAGAPTPLLEQQAARSDPCQVRRWRKSADGYEFQTSDGSWTTPTKDILPAFRNGERVNVSLGNKSGYGTGDGVTQLNVGSISGGSLRMTGEGQIGVGSWTGVVVSGANIGGGSSSTARPIEGRYELSGHMIAISDDRGATSYGLIGRDIEDGRTYIYLNGRQYWPEDQ